MANATPRPHGTAEEGHPRLLSLHRGAAYLGCSYWTLRDYVLQELLPVVALPPLRPREGDRPKRTLRRVLIDRHDLDAFVDRVKQDTRGISNPARNGNEQ